MSQLTEAQMKYLHVIYKAENADGGIRSVEIARDLGVSKAAVSRMMKLLAGMGLIFIKENGQIELTEKGKSAGSSIHRRVIEIHPFFADYLELNEPEATDSTYFFLSGFSKRCVDTLLGKGWTVKQSGI